MDAFARGLKNAAAVLEDGVLTRNVEVCTHPPITVPITFGSFIEQVILMCRIRSTRFFKKSFEWWEKHARSICV